MLRCHGEVRPHIPALLSISLQFMKYDPNYSYDDSEGEQDFDGDGDGQDDFSEDEEEEDFRLGMFMRTLRCGLCVTCRRASISFQCVNESK